MQALFIHRISEQPTSGVKAHQKHLPANEISALVLVKKEGEVDQEACSHEKQFN